MAEIQQQQETNSTPTLYNFYNDQYDYMSLRRAYDEGLNNYLATLKRGEKDREEFIRAGEALMEGLKSGRVTWGEGRFNDSQGEYTNSTGRNKHKDYYGLMANYIYGLMGNQSKYEKPEDKTKIKWNNGRGLVQAFYQDAFNSDTPNWEVWDQLDTKETGTKGRVSAFKEWLEGKGSDSSRFSDLGDADYKTIISKITERISDGNPLSPGDSLALNRYGFDYSKMFRDLNTKPVLTPEQQAAEKAKTQQEKQKAVIAEAESLFPELTSPYSEIISGLNNYTADDWTLLSQSLGKNSNAGLWTLFNQVVQNRNFILRISAGGKRYEIPRNAAIGGILRELGKRGLISGDSSNPDLFLLPGTYNKNRFSYYVWDQKTQKLQEISALDTPEGKKQVKDFFTSKGYGTKNNRFAIYMGADQVESKKEGGILKAQGGTSFNNIYLAEDNPIYNDYNKYGTWEFSQDSILNNISKFKVLEDYANFVKANTDQRYSAGVNDFGNNKKYTASDAIYNFNTHYQDQGNGFNNILFGGTPEDYLNQNALLGNNNFKFNRPLKALKTGDSYNEDATKAYKDNALGAQTYSRFASLSDKALTTGQFGNWGKKMKDLYGATGAYYYIADGDTSGRGQWIPTKDTSIKGYTAFDSTPTAPDPATQNPAASKLGTSVYPLALLKNKNSLWKQFSSSIDLIPWGIRTAGLIDSGVTNRHIKDDSLSSAYALAPRNYTYYIRGDFDTRQAGGRQAASTERLGDRIAASNADSTLGALAKLEANKQANDIRFQANAKDNQAYNESREKNVLAGEKTMENHNDIFNQNTVIRWKNKKENDQVLANYHKAGYLGRQNYRQENLKDYLTNKAERTALQQALDSQDIANAYSDYITAADERYRKYNPSGYSTRDSDPKYYNIIKAGRNWYDAAKARVLAGQHVTVPSSGEIDDLDALRAKIAFSRKGGLITKKK